MTTTVTNKNGIEFDIDALATDVNGKMDKDGVNATCPVVISCTPNEQGGVVEIWSDGYCVQTGIYDNGSNSRSITTNITFLQSYIDTMYTILTTTTRDGQGNNSMCTGTREKSTTGCVLNVYGYGDTDLIRYINWRTEGYIR